MPQVHFICDFGIVTTTGFSVRSCVVSDFHKEKATWETSKKQPWKTRDLRPFLASAPYLCSIEASLAENGKYTGIPIGITNKPSYNIPTGIIAGDTGRGGFDVNP